MVHMAEIMYSRSYYTINKDDPIAKCCVIRGPGFKSDLRSITYNLAGPYSAISSSDPLHRQNMYTQNSVFHHEN